MSTANHTSGPDGHGWRRGRWLLVLAALLATVVLGPLAEHGHVEVLFATTILIALLAFAIGASGRLAFGTMAACLPVLLLVVAARLKFRYLSTPLLAPDLYYYLSGDVSAALVRYPLVVSATTLALLLVPAVLVWLWRSDSRPSPSRKIRRLRAGGVLLGLAMLAMAALPRGPYAAVYAKGMWAAMNDESFIADFVASFRNAHIDEPTFHAVAGASPWQLPTTPAPAPTPAPKPDIIVVLEESTFNPRMLSACVTQPCATRMFQPDAHTIAHGWLNVHTWGGGTWTSEFAFLTGLPHTLFGPAGIYAPFNLAPRIRYTLPRRLDADGYRTVGIYPTAGDFMNGRSAYADYGFEAFHGGNELGLDWGATDADVFAAFKRVYAAEKAKAQGRPLFVFLLTLHQHGPHMTPLGELPAPYNAPLFSGRLAPGNVALDDWLNLNLTNYLQRLALSDTAMTQLQAFLQSTGTPTLLLHFGDHQPSFDGAINVLPKRAIPDIPDPRYATYYMLQGYNLPIQRQHYPTLDIAYLGSLLLDAAHIQGDPFYSANSLMRDRCGTPACRDAALRNSYRAWIFGHLDDLE